MEYVSLSCLVIVRHGQSEYNLQNLFTGWIDCGLSELGKEEARLAGQKLVQHHLVFDVAFCSELKRSLETYALIVEEGGDQYKSIPVHQRVALNERHYGQLQGINKEQAAREYGEEQVHIWRRGYDSAPPGGESLKDTAVRVIKFYEEEVIPLLAAGQRILIVAHGNSLRALMMRVENISPEKIEQVEIATGQVILYRFDEDGHVNRKEIL